MEENTLNDLLEEKIITPEEYSYLNRMATIDFLQTEKAFDCQKYLGEGSFGVVLLASSPAYGKKVAFKIVDRKDNWTRELDLWPKLDHKNLLPLLDVIKLQYTNVFITPALLKDMDTLLADSKFRNSSKSIEVTKKWLKETLDALDYLHSSNLCHLDVKADNILIDSDFTAVLCDFTFINYSDKPTDRFGQPMPYRAPETCLADESHILVDAVKIDMWSYGILTLNVLTGHFLSKKTDISMKYWHKDIYPLIFQAMKICYFRDLMASAFPGADISEEFTKAFNFVQFTLRLNPNDRPYAETTANHAFLMNGFHYLIAPDDIWITRATFSSSCACAAKRKNSSTEPTTPYKKRKMCTYPSSKGFTVVKQTPVPPAIGGIEMSGRTDTENYGEEDFNTVELGTVSSDPPNNVEGNKSDRF